MSGPPSATRAEKAPGKVPTDLVQEMCRKKIEPLTKAGAVSEGMTGMVRARASW